MNSLAQRAHLHALARDAAPAPGDQRGAGGHDRAAQVRRLRPDRGRDGRHRPERHGDRRPGRPVAVRDDERVRRREPAREDRHARLRRSDRAQQVREARRGGCAARRAQAVAAQSSRRATLPDARDPGLPDDREPVQRSRASIGCSKRCARAARREGGRASALAVADPGLDGAAAARDAARFPVHRTRYLAEIAQNGRRARAGSTQQRAEAASRAHSLHEALHALGDPQLPAAARPLSPDSALDDATTDARAATARRLQRRARCGRRRSDRAAASAGPTRVEVRATDDQYRYQVRGREI